MIRFLHQLNDRLEYLREKEAADMESKKKKLDDTSHVC